MVKHSFVCLLYCLVALTWSGALQAQSNAYIDLKIDSSEVYFGDTVVLEMESAGLLDPVDLSPLLAQAELVRETTGNRIAVFSGKVAKIKIRRIVLLPKAPGTLVIGPLTAGDVSSNSIHVKILDLARPNWQPQELELRIELLHRYPITGELIDLPKLSGFSQRTLLAERRTYKDENREWRRTEWRYLP